MCVWVWSPDDSPLFTTPDSPQCSVVFTDQQYEIDPVSGNVTVEWAGTGPTADLNVNEFECNVNGEGAVPCKPLYI